MRKYQRFFLAPKQCKRPLQFYSCTFTIHKTRSPTCRSVVTDGTVGESQGLVVVIIHGAVGENQELVVSCILLRLGIGLRAHRGRRGRPQVQWT